MAEAPDRGTSTPQPDALDVGPEQVRALLGLEAGDTLLVAPVYRRWRRWPPFLLALVLLAVGYGCAVALSPLSGTLAFLTGYLAATISVVAQGHRAPRPPSYRADEFGLVLVRGTGARTDQHRHGWAALSRIKGRELRFQSGTVALAETPAGDLVLSAARQMLMTLELGGAVLAGPDVPEAALSRMRGDPVEAPAAAISRTGGGRHA